MLVTSYASDDDALALLNEAQSGLVSAYAARRDYHDVVKGKLKQLAQWLARESGEEVKVFVDTAPLMEKPLAARAGLGWQGKHTNLVSREHGSWLFLGAILSAAEIEPDAPHEGPLRFVPRLPRYLSDQRVSGALQARCAALPCVPHDRAQRANRA